MTDRRDNPSLPFGWEADHDRMVLIDDNTGIEHRAHYEVCGVCDGRAAHVHPDIDRNGLTADDFAQDPDFMESYCRGEYDVVCTGCGGRRVTLAPSLPDGAQAFGEAWADEHAYHAEVAAERRMGA